MKEVLIDPNHINCRSVLLPDSAQMAARHVLKEDCLNFQINLTHPEGASPLEEQPSSLVESHSRVTPLIKESRNDICVLVRFYLLH